MIARDPAAHVSSQPPHFTPEARRMRATEPLASTTGFRHWRFDSRLWLHDTMSGGNDDGSQKHTGHRGDNPSWSESPAIVERRENRKRRSDKRGPSPPSREPRPHSGLLRRLTAELHKLPPQSLSRSSRRGGISSSTTTDQVVSSPNPPRRRVASKIEATRFSSSGMLGSNSYRYDPLEQSEIRLVMLHPARSWSIKCDISHFPLDQAPAYTAISYAWGDVGDERKIELQGVAVPITVSLHGALEALRERGGRPVWIWADALCIDQQNRDEKNQQLRLMTDIYKRAQSVAIWLGPERDNSMLATEFLKQVAERANNPEHIKSIFSSQDRRQGFEAVISLFERDYWDRLWVVQEVFNAESITVYCGTTKLDWSIYREASHLFWDYKSDLESVFPGGPNSGHHGSHKQLTCSQVLAYEGPGSLLDRRLLEEVKELEDEPDSILFQPLLDVMRRFRRKFCGEPKDKVFGILGVLPERIRREIPADYSLSVKDIYTNVVDTLIHTTNRLDIICESIHFPRHIGSANLPTWVPDWSYIPQVKALGAMYERNYSADGDRIQALWRFRDERRSKLLISAVYLGSIKTHGVAVGTLCNSADYLMAFLHWRALVLGNFPNTDNERRAMAQEDFCSTLSLGYRLTKEQTSKDWMAICYHVFASLINHRLPELLLDVELTSHITSDANVGDYQDRGKFLQKHFGSHMMGRCFCITDGDLMGLGTGFMTADDIVVVPFGCSTPIVLRPEGDEFRFVGDVYIHGYMHGKAVEEYADGTRELCEYVLH